ncbi:MAG: mandelate racemase/muconate lactonizing enzyme family protein [Cyclobacteriaceae bacterium]
MAINRRQFTGSLGMIILSALSGNALSSSIKGAGIKVDSISLYMVNVTKARNFSHSTWHNRQHVFIKIQAGKHTGWAEALVNKNDLDFDIAKWGSYLNELKGMPIVEAIEYCRAAFLQKKWNAKKSEPALIALYDITGKIANKPTIELWGLNKREAVPGLFCILEKDVNQALIQAQIAKEQQLTGYVKIKMFGDVEIDLALTVALRKFFGKEAFLMADANRGYKKWQSIDDLAMRMKNLQTAGLNAMEDPAELTTEQWIELQTKVGDFSLIPDRPMRPAHNALDLFNKEMGHYFNIHPDTMGTLKEAAELGEKIKAADRGLMIGDSSLIGPACTFWQQLAIGIGASWIEAIEKPQESDVFQQCVTQMSTEVANGKTKITNLRPGFGIQMDEGKLRDLSDKYAKLY